MLDQLRAISVRLGGTLLAGSAALFLVPCHAQSINDTGHLGCFDGTAVVACTAGTTGDAAGYPRQDGRFGRDARAAAGTLLKAGGGADGFDFTKRCMSGQEAGNGTCPANPLQGTGADQWACTRDNVTGLVWSLETVAGRTWDQAADAAAGSLIASYNGAGRCGYSSGWRVPTRQELFSIVHNGVTSPAIDEAYFPGTASGGYWAAEPYAFMPTNAWLVHFNGGYSDQTGKETPSYVRLVRTGI